ncbi:MAG: hypothetical protein LUE27_01645 [Clostridia bacterium]|nr:hypothetical protein [Clostridia bacterium]
MSAYLCFRKNGVLLVSFCRSAKIVEFMGHPNSDDWVPYDVNSMHYAFEDARSEEHRLSEHEGLLMEALHGNPDYETIMSVVQELRKPGRRLRRPGKPSAV